MASWHGKAKKNELSHKQHKRKHPHSFNMAKKRRVWWENKPNGPKLNADGK